ncbi:MAG TPA: UTP--glucose-1-phosphate uridylyltransferase, partial [Rhodospirillaceae bacterium]|nr:UTP--glucose-1-phosphate uridylyltransferase [Rhodospirillaceae bacterium]
AIMLPDDVVLAQTPCLSQMVKAYNKTGGNLVGVMDVPREDTRKYGILDVRSDDGKLADIKGLVEKPDPKDAPSTLSIIGRYILQPEIFEKLSVFEKGAGGEIQLTDAMAKMIGAQPFHGLRFDGRRYDCGHHLGFIEANIAFSMQNANIGAQVKEIIEEITDCNKEKNHAAAR